MAIEDLAAEGIEQIEDSQELSIIGPGSRLLDERYRCRTGDSSHEQRFIQQPGTAPRFQYFGHLANGSNRYAVLVGTPEADGLKIYFFRIGVHNRHRDHIVIPRELFSISGGTDPRAGDGEIRQQLLQSRFGL